MNVHGNGRLIDSKEIGKRFIALTAHFDRLCKAFGKYLIDILRLHKKSLTQYNSKQLTVRLCTTIMCN